MKLHKLRSYQQPDLSEHVIHFTGRNGVWNEEVSGDIRTLSARARLFNGILEDRAILAHRVFWMPTPTPPVVCLTECAPSGISTLISEGRYPPYGIVFTKDFVFGLGGSPALYVRKDEWSEIGCLPPEMRARCTPYWPGAEPEFSGEQTFGSANEWTHEREWRVLGSGDPPALRFEPGDIAFLIIGDWAEMNQNYRCVQVDRWTGKIEDPDSVWLPTDGPARLHVM